jgi:hypothetical protein
MLSCILAKTSDSTNKGSIGLVDASGGNLFDISLLDRTVFNMAPAATFGAQHGLEIIDGTTSGLSGES